MTVLARRHSAADILLLDKVANASAAAATASLLYVVDNTANIARALTHAGVRQAASDIALGAGNWLGATATSDRLYFVDQTTRYARAWDLSGTRQAASDINLLHSNVMSAVSTPTRLFFQAGVTAYAYDLSGVAVAADNIALPSGNWSAAVRINTRIFFADMSASRIARAWDESGARQADDDFALADNYVSAVAFGDYMYFLSGFTLSAYIYAFAGAVQGGLSANKRALIYDTDTENLEWANS